MSRGEGYNTNQFERLEAALGTSGSGDAAPPQAVGRYDILEPIGQGGMGQVYKAEQRAPVRRTVALKLIKLGMDSRAVVRRFDAERQALAWMDHPNVARALDAGTDPLSGRPYFVMEYVPGLPITRYCDERRLTVRQRLELFIDVCDAVAHAHQKMVVHRDLKPSNILVAQPDGAPAQVKVIDFGIAKALGQPDGDAATVVTEAGHRVGTAEYMSPEQAGGLDVDTRSDIYSLGVVLYELLAGALPFDSQVLRALGMDGIARTLRETEPPRPGTRLSGLGADDVQAIAQRRQTHGRELSRMLRGELEWIPLKAMRKQRDRRYATASELAQDIQNYLEHKPLIAGPESRAYRLRKFARRNKGALSSVAMLALLLAAGVALYVRAIRAEQARTTEALTEAREVTEFQAQMLSGIDAQVMGRNLRESFLAEAEQSWRRATADASQVARRRAELEALIAGANFTNTAIRTLDENIVSRALETIQTQFAQRPVVQARLLQQLADVLRNFTLVERATAPQATALEIRLRELGDEHPDTLRSMFSTAMLLTAKGRWAQAEPYARRVLDSRRRLFGEQDLQTVLSKKLMAEVLQRQGRLVEAEAYRRETMEGCRRLLGEDDPQTLDAVLKLGQVLRWQDRLDEAEVYIERAVAGLRRVRGENDAQTLKTVGIMGMLRVAQGRLPEAEPILRQAYEGLRLQIGDDQRETLFWVMKIGTVLRLQGRPTEAQPYLERALDGLRALLGSDHADTLSAMLEIGLLRQDQGRLPEAEAYMRRALDGYQRDAQPPDEEVLDVLGALGGLLESQQRWAEAEPIFAELYDRGAPARGGAAPAARRMSHHGRCLVKLGRFEEAEPRLRAAYERLVQSGQERHEFTRGVVSSLIEVAEHAGRADEAARWRAELGRLRATTQPAGPVSGSDG